MSKTRQAKEEVLRMLKERQEDEKFRTEDLPKLDELVKEYDYQVARFDGGMGPPDAREDMFYAMRQLTEDRGWYWLMEFYRRNRKR